MQMLRWHTVMFLLCPLCAQKNKKISHQISLKLILPDFCRRQVWVSIAIHILL